MSPVLLEAIWGDAATAVWVMTAILGLSGKLSWRGFFSLMVVVQALNVESLILGENTLLDIGHQCGWLTLAVLMWRRAT